MIVHFLEVWALMAAAFAIGSLIGALAYELLAQSPVGGAQLAVAEVVGKATDRLKERMGIDPTWREYSRIPGAVIPPERGEPFDDQVERRERPLAPPRTERPYEPPAFDPENDAEAPYPIALEPVDISLPEGVLPMRPAGLTEPRRGVPDNLQKIMGIGKKNEKVLNSLGIFHFGQIAAWTPAEMAWIGQRIAFPERIEWDDWIGQAVVLASGGDVDISKSEEPTPRDTLFVDDEDAEDDPEPSPRDDDDFDDDDDPEQDFDDDFR